MKYTFWSAILCLFMTISGDLSGNTGPEIGKKVFPLSAGTPVPIGEFEAVGTVIGVGFCSATLITDDLVLTAGHCVCPGGGSQVPLTQCVTRATFTLVQVNTVSNPSVRSDVQIQGDVRVHPQYAADGWARMDYAVIELDQPANALAVGVNPIPLAPAQDLALPGQNFTLVGFGATGQGCTNPGQGKLQMDVEATSAGALGVVFNAAFRTACPGDSGGPALDSAGRVAGVASWTNRVDESTYRPTATVSEWILGQQPVNWTACKWVNVGAKESHGAKSNWCPNGQLLTQFDLDGDRNYDVHDAPIVGQARCCNPPGQLAQITSKNVSVPNGGHSQTRSWCQAGGVLLGLDLDGDRSFSGYDTPIIGKATCGNHQGLSMWGSAGWYGVGALESHGTNSVWCPNGHYIAAVDLDGERGISEYDAPIVGRSLCASLRK